MNNRRKLLVALGAGAIAPTLDAFAQKQGKAPRIGVLSPGNPPPDDPFRQAERFEAGLRELMKSIRTSSSSIATRRVSLNACLGSPPSWFAFPSTRLWPAVHAARRAPESDADCDRLDPQHGAGPRNPEPQPGFRRCRRDSARRSRAELSHGARLRPRADPKDQGCDRQARDATSTALIEALQHLGVSRVVLGAAYDDKVNAIARAFLESNGIKVLAAHGLGLVDNLVVGRLGSDSAYELARKIDRPDAEAIVLACTNWKTMDVIEQLERELGKPVVSTTQVSVWAALRAIGRIEGVSGYGQLLRDLTAPSKHTQLA